MNRETKFYIDRDVLSRAGACYLGAEEVLGILKKDRLGRAFLTEENVRRLLKKQFYRATWIGNAMRSGSDLTYEARKRLAVAYNRLHGRVWAGDRNENVAGIYDDLVEMATIIYNDRSARK